MPRVPGVPLENQATLFDVLRYGDCLRVVVDVVTVLSHFYVMPVILQLSTQVLARFCVAIPETRIVFGRLARVQGCDQQGPA